MENNRSRARSTLRFAGPELGFSAGRRLALRASWGLGLGVIGKPRSAAAGFNYTQRSPYRAQAARHVYATYQQRIFKGKLPPLLYAIAIIETVVDRNGNVISAVVTREPASAKEIGPWAVSMIRAASPFPRPTSGTTTRFSEIWLVDESGAFQLDSPDRRAALTTLR